MKQYIITIPVTSRSDGRRVVEAISGSIFSNRAALEEVLCYREDDPMATEDLHIYTIDEWVQACNKVDDDYPDIDLMDVWLGTVFMIQR